MKWTTVLSGFIGATILVIVLFAISIWIKPFDYQAVCIINTETALKTDSLTCNQIAVLRDLESKGILLTPQEYTSHISSYYSTLVAFLIGLFVFFTVGSIYGIRITSRREIEEAKLNIKDELKSSLANEIKDSKSFSESIISVLKENMKENILTKSDNILIEINSELRKLNDKQTKLSEDIELIYEEIEVDAKSDIKEA